MVAMALQRYRLRLVPGFDPRCRGFISLQPVNGMRMILKRRDPSSAVRAAPAGRGEPAAAEPVVTEPVAAAMRAHGCPYSARA
jgi:hypothetical protein